MISAQCSVHYLIKILLPHLKTGVDPDQQMRSPFFTVIHGISVLFSLTTVTLLKFRTLLLCQKGIDK